MSFTYFKHIPIPTSSQMIVYYTLLLNSVFAVPSFNNEILAELNSTQRKTCNLFVEKS